MAYYNRNLKMLKLKRKKLEYLSHGNCAKVFRYGDNIFKEYYSETGNKSRLNPKVFDILKDINHNHFIKLFEIYGDMDLLELLIYVCDRHSGEKDSFQVDSYMARYYSSDSINVLLEEVGYILDNFRELDLLFDVFTESGIKTTDVKSENTVINRDKIIIVDPDCFSISKVSASTLKIQNKEMLLHLFKSICKTSVAEFSNSREMMTKIDDKLADITVNKNTDIAYEISKKLKYVKKPIDYFMK